MLGRTPKNLYLQIGVFYYPNYCRLILLCYICFNIISNNMDKICTGCKKSKPATIEFFSKYRNRCKACRAEYMKQYNSRDEVKKKHRNWQYNRRVRDPDKAREKGRLQYKKNCRKPENIKKERLSKKNAMETLTRSYVANSLKLRVSELTPEIYQTRKIIIQLKRELKNNNIKIR